MDTIIKSLELQKSGDKFHDFVISDAIYYIKKAQEALVDGMLDPQQWYQNEQINSKTFFSLFPQIYFTQQHFSSVSEMDTNSS